MKERQGDRYQELLSGRGRQRLVWPLGSNRTPASCWSISDMEVMVVVVLSETILTLQPKLTFTLLYIVRLALNYRPSCLFFLNAGIIGM